MIIYINLFNLNRNPHNLINPHNLVILFFINLNSTDDEKNQINPDLPVSGYLFLCYGTEYPGNRYGYGCG